MRKLHSSREIGQLVRAARRGRGWDQAELAQRVGVSRQWVISLEQGAPRARVDLVLQAMSALGIGLFVEPIRTGTGPPGEGRDGSS